MLNSNDSRIKWKYLPEDDSRQSARPFIKLDAFQKTKYAKKCFKHNKLTMNTTIPEEVAVLILEGKEAPSGDIIARWNHAYKIKNKKECKKIENILRNNKPICVYVEI